MEAVDGLIEKTLEPAALDTPAARMRNRSRESEAERQRQREEKNAETEARLRSQLQRTVGALLDHKAEKLVVLRLEGLTAMTDYFVVATATNSRQAQAMTDAVEEAMREEGRRPLSIEGYQTAKWILLDFGDAVFHIFDEETRRFYGLERLWGDAPDETGTFAGG